MSHTAPSTHTGTGNQVTYPPSFCESCQHDYERQFLIPDNLPKLGTGVWQGSLSGDVLVYKVSSGHLHLLGGRRGVTDWQLTQGEQASPFYTFLAALRIIPDKDLIGTKPSPDLILT